MSVLFWRYFVHIKGFKHGSDKVIFALLERLLWL